MTSSTSSKGIWELRFSSSSLQPNIACYNLTHLLYCAEALRLHSGSLLTLIQLPLRESELRVCVQCQSISVISVLCEVFANTK